MLGPRSSVRPPLPPAEIQLAEEEKGPRGTRRRAPTTAAAAPGWGTAAEAWWASPTMAEAAPDGRIRREELRVERTSVGRGSSSVDHGRHTAAPPTSGGVHPRAALSSGLELARSRRPRQRLVGELAVDGGAAEASASSNGCGGAHATSGLLEALFTWRTREHHVGGSVPRCRGFYATPIVQ